MEELKELLYAVRESVVVICDSMAGIPSYIVVKDGEDEALNGIKWWLEHHCTDWAEEPAGWVYELEESPFPHVRLYKEDWLRPEKEEQG